MAEYLVEQTLMADDFSDTASSRRHRIEADTACEAIKHLVEQHGGTMLGCAEDARGAARSAGEIRGKMYRFFAVKARSR